MENFGKNLNKDTQTELTFESSEDTLKRVLMDINNSYPLIREVIEGRITYDGKNFIINDKKMTESELREAMSRLNKYKIDNMPKDVSEDKNKHKVEEDDEDDRIKDTPGWDLYTRYKGY